jgi:hypothetical protein
MDILGNFEAKLKELPNEKAEKISISRGFISKVNSKRKKLYLENGVRGLLLSNLWPFAAF